MGWDMLHGNVLLRGWTASDVPFYTIEVPLLALVELMRGLSADVVHVCAAVLYTALTVGVMLLARGRSRGWVAIARVGVALAVMAVPVPGIDESTMLSSPDHAGTTAVLLFALVAVDRWPSRRATPWIVGALLALGQVSDPLMLTIGAVPALVVCGARLARETEPDVRTAGRGPDLWLAVAAATSIVVARMSLWLLGLAGLRIHPVGAELAGPGLWRHNLWLLADGLSVVFGAYLPDRTPGLDWLAGVIRGVLLLAAMVALMVLLARWARPGGARRVPLVDTLLLAAAAANMLAFVATTIPKDVYSNRQVVSVPFLGAIVLGRLVGPRLVQWWTATGRTLARRSAVAFLALALLITTTGEILPALSRPVAAPNGSDLAAFLLSHRLTYGLGMFWAANDITLQTGGRIHVVPATGTGHLFGYAWLSEADWYDPSHHDARFVVSYASPHPDAWTETDVRAQFGEPAARYVVGNVVVLVYDRNLLVGLPAACGSDEIRPSMAMC
jgi:hypothetical protein